MLCFIWHVLHSCSMSLITSPTILFACSAFLFACPAFLFSCAMFYLACLAFLFYVTNNLSYNSVCLLSIPTLPVLCFIWHVLHSCSMSLITSPTILFACSAFLFACAMFYLACLAFLFYVTNNLSYNSVCLLSIPVCLCYVLFGMSCIPVLCH